MEMWEGVVINLFIMYKNTIDIYLSNHENISLYFVGGHLQIAGGGALPDTPGDVIMRAVAGAVIPPVVTWGATENNSNR